MSLLFPPFWADAVDDEGYLELVWRNFIIELYNQFNGDIDFTSDDTLSSSTINLNALSINDVSIPNPNTANQVLELTSTTASTWIDQDPLSAGEHVGMEEFTVNPTPPTGWLIMDDGTIGSASSGASTLASSEAQELFEFLWNNYADSECAVSSGRGADATSDFNANKTINLPKVLNRIAGIAGSGTGLTSRDNGVIVGESDHLYDKDELSDHDHIIYGHQTSGTAERQVARYDKPSTAVTTDKVLQVHITDADINLDGESTLPNVPQTEFNIEQPYWNCYKRIKYK